MNNRNIFSSKFSRDVSERMRKALAYAIDELPERNRLILSLRHNDELNFQEIGLVLGIDESLASKTYDETTDLLSVQMDKKSESVSD